VLEPAPVWGEAPERWVYELAPLYNPRVIEIRELAGAATIRVSYGDVGAGYEISIVITDTELAIREP
jgi:hypothetical protein